MAGPIRYVRSCGPSYSFLSTARGRQLHIRHSSKDIRVIFYWPVSFIWSLTLFLITFRFFGVTVGRWCAFWGVILTLQGIFDYTFAQKFWIQTQPTTQFSFVVMPWCPCYLSFFELLRRTLGFCTFILHTTSFGGNILLFYHLSPELRAGYFLLCFVWRTS